MEKQDLRIVFMGTPEFAVGTLQKLVEGKYNIVAVITQPDKPVGRHGSVLTQSAVKQYALKHNIPVLQPEKMKDETIFKNMLSIDQLLDIDQWARDFVLKEINETCRRL